MRRFLREDVFPGLIIVPVLLFALIGIVGVFVWGRWIMIVGICMLALIAAGALFIWGYELGENGEDE